MPNTTEDILRILSGILSVAASATSGNLKLSLDAASKIVGAVVEVLDKMSPDDAKAAIRAMAADPLKHIDADKVLQDVLRSELRKSE